MKPNLKVYRMLLLSAAIVSMPAWLSGCASSGADATVRKAEKLVATHPVKRVKMVKQAPAQSRSAEEVPDMPAEGPAWASLPPPAMGPGRADISKKHLLELYAGQQAIIETLEANSTSRGGMSPEEAHASDLPEDISQEDLLRILGQQQKLIKALTDRSSKHVRH